MIEGNLYKYLSQKKFIQYLLSCLIQVERSITKALTNIHLSVLFPAALFFVVVSTIMWRISLDSVDIRKMTDLGLVNVLPALFYLAIFILTMSYLLLNNGDPEIQPVLVIHTILLILIIHGTPNILYGTVRYAWTYKHIGIVDYIIRNHGVNPQINYLNVYHDWPGFFALSAFITQVAGFQSAMNFAGWAPVFFNLVDLPALIMIFRALSKDQRVVYLGVWFFYITNWIGQDYFAPQAMTYFLYAASLGVILTWFSTARFRTSRMIPFRWMCKEKWSRIFSTIGMHSIVKGARKASHLQKAALILIVGLIFMVIASSHQLTPFVLISVLVFLAIFQIIRNRSLPLLIAILTASWIFFMGVTFLQGNIGWITRSIGTLTGNVSSNFHSLSQASHGQVLVAWMNRALTGSVGLLAFLGFLRRFKAGTWDMASILLVIAPIPMVPANAYGGEMIFRVYFFALPFMAFLAAGIFFPTPHNGRSLQTFAGTAVICLGLLVGFFFGYYGKEQINYFSTQEMQASEFLVNKAPRGSLVITGTAFWPVDYQNYEARKYLAISTLRGSQVESILKDPVHQLLGYAKGSRTAFIVFSRSQILQVNSAAILPPGSLGILKSKLGQSPEYKVVFQNSDATIFQVIK